MTSLTLERRGQQFYDDSTKALLIKSVAMWKGCPKLRDVIYGRYKSHHIIQLYTPVVSIPIFSFLTFCWNVRLVTTISFGEPWCGTSICLPSSSFDSSPPKFKQGNYWHRCCHQARIKVVVGPRPRDFLIFTEQIFLSSYCLNFVFCRSLFYLVGRCHFC